MIEETSIVVSAQKKRYSHLNKDVVILDLQTEEYYGLNHVGATIWKLIQEPKTVRDIRELMLSKYNVESKQCDRDLKVFLEKLEAQKLIEVRNLSFA